MIRIRTALLTCLLMAGGGVAQEAPAYQCVRAAEAPEIDGNGGDLAWTHAPELHLVDVEDLAGGQHSRPTTAKILWDEDNLYFLFTMADADVWSTYSNRDDQLYEEEVVEIFIDPDGDGLNYAEIEINPLNTIFDLLLSRPWADGGRGFAQWDPEFFSAIAIDGTLNDSSDADDGWRVEMALPWTALATELLDVMNGQSLPPQPGDRWRLNLYRFERIRADGAITAAEASAWSPVGVTDFHRPDRFGWLVFAAAATVVEPQDWARVKAGAPAR